MEVLQLMFDFILHVDDYLTVIAIIIVSILPPIHEYFNHRRPRARASVSEA